MALPYSGLPHTRCVDGVWPAELAQAVVDKCNDARALVAVEHRVRDPLGGEHNSPQIAIANALLVTPQGQSPAGSSTATDGQSYGWTPKGFRDAPRWVWTPGSSTGVLHFIEFTLPLDVSMSTAKAYPALNTGAPASAELPAVAPRFEWISEHEGRFWFGDGAAVANLYRVMILVYGVRTGRGS